MSYSPRVQRVLDALVALLAAEMNTHLATCGQAALPASAFGPIPPGDITGDAIAVVWQHNIRAISNERGRRLTIADRDKDLIFMIEVYVFGATDQAAQSRGIACEYALETIFDLDKNQRLGDLCGTPIEVGDTSNEIAETKDRSSLVWHLTVPILCHVRTTRPEYQP